MWIWYSKVLRSVHSFESEFQINTVHVQTALGGGVDWESVLIHKWLLSPIRNEALRNALLEMSKRNSWVPYVKFVVGSVWIIYLLTTDACNIRVWRKCSSVRRKFLFIFPRIYQGNQKIYHLYYTQSYKIHASVRRTGEAFYWILLRDLEN
jgi:hypothetical protein